MTDSERPTSSPAPRPRSAPVSPSMASRLEAIAKQRPPPPRGRAVVLIAVALVVGYMIFRVFSDMSRTREGREPERAPTVPVEGPREAREPSERREPRVPGPEPVRPEPRRAEPLRETPALPALPAGLPTSVERRLLLVIGAVRPDPSMPPDQWLLIASAGVRDLAAVPAEVTEEHRGAVRDFVLRRLEEAAADPRLRTEAFDAAARLGLAAGEAPALVGIAAGKGLAEDSSAAAALLFLETLPDRGGTEAAQRILEVVRDKGRPLHVRVLAARARPPGDLPESLRRVADDESEAEVLRRALR